MNVNQIDAYPEYTKYMYSLETDPDINIIQTVSINYNDKRGKDKIAYYILGMCNNEPSLPFIIRSPVNPEYNTFRLSRGFIHKVYNMDYEIGSIFNNIGFSDNDKIEVFYDVKKYKIPCFNISRSDTRIKKTSYDIMMPIILCGNILNGVRYINSIDNTVENAIRKNVCNSYNWI